MTNALSSLPNIGPKSRQMLEQAGITNVEQLRALGLVAAYVQVKRAGCNASLNLLWALEAALGNQHWQDVARLHRTSLLLVLENIEKQ